MQIGRLFQIVYLLLSRGNVTARELADRFEVSVRTIYRDLDALSGAGIPVYASRGKGGGVRLLPDFVLDKSLLSEEEQDEILFALQGMHATNAVDDSVLSRLGGLFRRQGGDWIEVDFSYWGSGEKERQKFTAIKSAILERRAVHFRYYASNGQSSDRTAEPARLCFKSGAWYMQGYCLDRKSYRTFKVCRMDMLTVTEQKSVHQGQPPPLEALGPPQKGEWEPIVLQLRVSAEQAYRIYDMFGGTQMTKNADGSVEITVRFPEDNWVYGFLMSFGAGLEVLSPPRVRRRLREESEKIKALYADA